MVTLDENLVASLRDDYTRAPISQQDRAMLDYVAQLTRDATRLTPQDHDKLRAVGFDDTAILQITLIASWFNYINRVADALGVGRGTREDWYQTDELFVRPEFKSPAAAAAIDGSPAFKGREERSPNQPGLVGDD
jgi:hypothetical protein